MTITVTVASEFGVTAGQSITVTGTCKTDELIQLAVGKSNTTPPAGPYFQATTTQYTYDGTVTFPAAGTFYVWASDPISGDAAASAAIEVTYPGTNYVDAVPLTTDEAAAIFGGTSGGLTIDKLPDAAPARMTDKVLTGQGSDVSFAQTLSAIWSLFTGALPAYLGPVVEVTANTTLDASTTNSAVVVATTAGITVSANFTNMGSGFRCTLINASAGAITLGSGITTNTGASSLAAGQWATIVAATLAAGNKVFARL